MARLMVCPWTGKRIYWSRELAVSECNRQHKHGMRVGVYECNKCGKFHLHTMKKKHKKIKREKPDESLPN